MQQHPLNQAVIAQILHDLRNGQLRRALDMGLTEEDLKLLKDPKLVSVLLNTPVRWSTIKVDPKIMHRLLERVLENEKEITIIDEMLKLEASSKMISDVFGLDQREIALRKRVLGIEKKQGRWSEITEQQNHDIWREWIAKIDKYQLDKKNSMDMAKLCMIISKKWHIPMAMIWQAIEKWLEEDIA